MKKRLQNIFIVLFFLLGLSLVLYPSVSDYWNSFHQSKAIQSYAENVVAMDDSEYEHILEEAKLYNERLAESNQIWKLSPEQLADYNSQLNVAGNGLMSYIEIPKISCTLPIYHGTGDAVLQIAIGHIEGSSLPVGGESTHCVLSGHRGLPSAKLFSNLDQMVEGDIFWIRTLNEIYTYEVDQIRIVLPNELNDVRIEEGKDFCTLVTCTPYSINTHRLLVRGHRVENGVNSFDIRVVADATQIDPVTVAPALAIPMLIVLLIWMLIRYRREKRRIKIA